MGIISAAAAAVAFSTLANGASALVAPATEVVGGDGEVLCELQPAMLAVDATMGPLLVSTVDARRAPAPIPQGQWGQAALRPYDVMSSLGSGGSPGLPAGLSLADAPAPLPVSSPLAWVLATAGLLGMLYVRRTQL
jgi:hypothetical protein